VSIAIAAALSIAIARAAMSIAIAAAVAVVIVSIAVAIVIAIVTVTTIVVSVAVVAAAVSVIGTVIISAVPSIPGASADKDSADKPARSVISIRGAGIGGVRVISPGAYRGIIAVYVSAIHYCGRYWNADANAY